MVALAHAVTGSSVFAEDLAQEAFIRAERDWDRLGHYDKPGAWVRQVTIRLAISARRRMTSELRAKLRLGRPATIDPPPPAEERLWAEVRRLPARQRAAVALFYVEDRPVAEIAELLGCAESTARVHLTRGRARLSGRLGGTP